MNFIKKLIAVTLSVATIATLSGCSTADTSWIAEYDGVKIPAGVYLSALLDSQTTAMSKAPEGTEEKNLLKTTIEEMPASEWIVKEAQKSVAQYIAVEKKFAEMGLTLTDEQLGQVRNNLELQWTYLQSIYESNGIAKSSLELVVMNSAKANAIFYSIYGKGGTKEIPQADLAKYFAENYAVVNYIATTKTDDIGQPYAQEDLDKAKAEIQAFVDRAKAGESFNSLIVENEKNKAPDAELNHAHTDENSHDTVVPKDSEQFPKIFVEEIFKTEFNTPVFIDDENYYFAAVRKDPLANATFLENYTNSVIHGLKSEEYQEELKTLSQATEGITYNQEALKLYTANKIK